MKLLKIYGNVLFILMLTSCNNMNKNGKVTTDEGTTVTNNVNSEMENNRTKADVDTVTSPGSNYENIKKGNYSVSDEQKAIPKDKDY